MTWLNDLSEDALIDLYIKRQRDYVHALYSGQDYQKEQAAFREVCDYYLRTLNFDRPADASLR